LLLRVGFFKISDSTFFIPGFWKLLAQMSKIEPNSFLAAGGGLGFEGLLMHRWALLGQSVQIANG